MDITELKAIDLLRIEVQPSRKDCGIEAMKWEALLLAVNAGCQVELVLVANNELGRYVFQPNAIAAEAEWRPEPPRIEGR